jgi:hypothetical protein
VRRCIGRSLGPGIRPPFELKGPENGNLVSNDMVKVYLEVDFSVTCVSECKLSHHYIMSSLKRQHSDHEDAPSAKRHNGDQGGQNQPDDKGKQRAPPPTEDSNSNKTQNGGHLPTPEPEESSPSFSKKRGRDESTDVPEAKRANNSSIKSADKSKPSYDYAYRIKLHTKLRKCATLEDCAKILNVIPGGNLIALAFAINDAKEEHRLQLLDQIPPNLSTQISEILANAYMDKRRYDPKSLFPSIASPKLMQVLPLDERVCNICKSEFEKLRDMLPKGCGKHSFHKDCLIKELQSGKVPFFALCECLAAA